MQFNPFALSSYLALRYVARAGEAWLDGVRPSLPQLEHGAQTKVETPAEILGYLRARLASVQSSHTGILLSGGIDSAILAALAPKGTHAFTIRFVAPGAIDESRAAAAFASASGLVHHVVDVTWEHHERHLERLMRFKRSPLHAIEVGLFTAAERAAELGLGSLIVGNGADSTFGGLDKLLSKDWGFDEFVARYTFLAPERVLVAPQSMRAIFEPYRRGDGIDVSGFLKVVHGLGIVQCFENAIRCAGLSIIAPYEELALAKPLDLARIRNGEPKYLLRGVFRELYGCDDVPEKIAFARPMDRWLEGWPGPRRAEFLPDIDMQRLNGEQRWLVYCLERFLNQLEAAG